MEKLGDWFGGLGMFLLSNLATDFVYMCRYTHLHELGYLDNKQWNFNAFRNIDCPLVPEIVPVSVEREKQEYRQLCKVRLEYESSVASQSDMHSKDISFMKFRVLALFQCLLSDFSLGDSFHS